MLYKVITLIKKERYISVNQENYFRRTIHEKEKKRKEKKKRTK